MIGIIASVTMALVLSGVYVYQKRIRTKTNTTRENRHLHTGHTDNMPARTTPPQTPSVQLAYTQGGRNQPNQPPEHANRTRVIPMQERTETGPMIYYANDRHGQDDKEYRFNYKKIDGAWRAYILRMPDLHGRDPGSIPTHRLWGGGQTPYICWQGTVTSLKDMQNISRVWADSIQEYIATGTRFGPE